MNRIYRTLSNLLSRRDHFAPHLDSGFEGYYSRTQLEDGATLALIFCWVKGATTRPNLVHISYTPAKTDCDDEKLTDIKGKSLPGFKYEFFPETLTLAEQPRMPDGQRPFSAHMAGIGTMKVGTDAVEFTVDSHETDLRLNLRLTNRVPWSGSDPLSGPMGFTARLSSLLPLNWHVHSTASKASYTISHAGRTLSGTGVAHYEKNWGSSFPPGWIWSQSFSSGGTDGSTSLCLAGGAAMPGVDAYLVGYRSPKLRWDFRPPFAMAIFSFSLFMRTKHDSRTGVFELCVKTLSRKLVVKMNAPSESFMGIAAPLKDGHRPMFAFESFESRTWVEAWARRWPWQHWTLVEEGECGVTKSGTPCAALEFGGSYCHHVQTDEGK